MSTLSLHNLIFKGVHGATGRESIDPQRFAINIDIELDVSKAITSDSLRDTYDYKTCESIARKIIQEERHVLIETLASRTAERICFDSRVNEVKVTIVKIDASSNGIPSFTITKKRVPAEHTVPLLDFDLDTIIARLKTSGGISIPILPELYLIS